MDVAGSRISPACDLNMLKCLGMRNRNEWWDQRSNALRDLGMRKERTVYDLAGRRRDLSSVGGDGMRDRERFLDMLKV